MIRTVLCGFAFGVWSLQQRAALPSTPGIAGYMACAAAAAAFTAQRIPRCARSRSILLRRCAVYLLILVAACLAGYSGAAWRAHLRLARFLPHTLEGRDLCVTGIIRGVPIIDARHARFVFEIERFADQGIAVQSMPRFVQLNWYARDDTPLPRLRAGERWQLTIRLKRPHGSANPHGADFEAMMLERNLRAVGTVRAYPAPRHETHNAHGLAIFLARWRDAEQRHIKAVLSGAPHAGIVIALATGLQSAISADDWQRFTRTGTNHLVAISGLHISLVAGLAAWLAGGVWRRMRLFGRAGPLWLATPRIQALAGASAGMLYAALAGFGIPAQRACVMLTVVALALVLGRGAASSVVLAWALAAVVCIDPWAVTSAGFWLSFSAVAIILAAVRAQSGAAHRASPSPPFPPFAAGTAHSARKRLTRALRAARLKIVHSIRIQSAVSIGMIPFIAIWFSQISLISPLANLCAIPWFSFLITPLALIGAILPAPIDAYAFRAAHALLSGLIRILDILTAPSWALLPLPAPNSLALGCAAAGLAIMLMPRGGPARWTAFILFAPLFLPPRAVRSAGQFRLTALDVGQGSALLIETAHHRLLFDAGPRYSAQSDAGQRIVLPFLRAHGIRRLDALVLSHADADHAGGARATVEAVPVARLRASLPSAHPLWRMARTAGIRDVQRCRAGERWQWDQVSFELLWPDMAARASDSTPVNTNAQSCVLRISNRRHAALLTADIDARTERALVERYGAALSATLLIAPHHGSRTSSTERFLDAVHPRAVVFQVGYRNPFHHPHPSVAARYAAHGILSYRSDRDGAVQVESFGHTLVVERYRVMHRRYWMGH
ncbi:DNA internalization-related competence protein ComA [Candidatus Glomeribacter gigasporarum BEG34]|uniref:DNA internalization-related competence protein ComA n=1 Tax=Candidatus Glomeribacter gigasporarum BEG34 TaxID=1070319 RepID=G2J8F9_9BURK|nr:DNA internalization-related competence protein ComEC/Rec2 [Candidatus Glomeribacter gigasporarum]CCD29056.1 DNA internalization-related competence protein ComA [Candidatus Glomeribacter gigasporarum BEG34]